tara:strand:- start:1141 stop:1890 length:750 start_codon:yes stop_codon:yes gene_type:complete
MDQRNICNSDSPRLDDDEIDLIELAKTLWTHKRIVWIATLVLILLSVIYSLVSTKQYKSEATFFISSSEKPTGSLMGYASMLGVDTPSNIESLIKNVLESYSIKVAVAHNYADTFSDTIEHAIAQGHIPNEPAYINNFLISTLKLGTNFSFSVDKNHLFRLTYISDQPKRAQDVLDHYIKNIIHYNESLNISAEKDIITVVDPARIPLAPFKPKLRLNLIMSSILGIFLSSLFVLIRHSIVGSNTNASK